MENASKALLMAASVLVGILILSLIAYLYTIFGDYGSLIQAALRLERHRGELTLEDGICLICRQISSYFINIRKNRTPNVHGNYRRFSASGLESSI